MSQPVQNPPEFTRTGICKAVDLKTIDTEGLNRMLLDQIQELEQKGLVDQNFGYCHSLKDVSGVSFFLDLILVFLADVHAVVENMAKTLKASDVDFNEMYAYYVKLKGSSSCIGACRLKDTCSYLRQSIEKKSRDGCNSALNCINHEHGILNDQLDIIIKIEQEIVTRLSV